MTGLGVLYRGGIEESCMLMPSPKHPIPISQQSLLMPLSQHNIERNVFPVFGSTEIFNPNEKEKVFVLNIIKTLIYVFAPFAQRKFVVLPPINRQWGPIWAASYISTSTYINKLTFSHPLILLYVWMISSRSLFSPCSLCYRYGTLGT